MSSNRASARRCWLVRTCSGRPSRPPSARHRASVWLSTTCSIRLKLIGSKAPKILPMPVSGSTKAEAVRALRWRSNRASPRSGDLAAAKRRAWRAKASDGAFPARSSRSRSPSTTAAPHCSAAVTRADAWSMVMSPAASRRAVLGISASRPPTLAARRASRPDSFPLACSTEAASAPVPARSTSAAISHMSESILARARPRTEARPRSSGPEQLVGDTASSSSTTARPRSTGPGSAPPSDSQSSFSPMTTTVNEGCDSQSLFSGKGLQFGYKSQPLRRTAERL